MPSSVRITRAQSAADLAQVRDLFVEYAEDLGFDLCFQDLGRELIELPGEYGPPGGALLAAHCGEAVVGCVALRKLDERTCEMKRMYVRPAFRGRHIGRGLAESIIAEARRIGYAKVRLDTLPSMETAVALYESLGFKRIGAYRHNPILGAMFFELDLRESASRGEQ
jgi:ribosomal protein S18 acetylase RimI-like enzyme